MMINDKGYKSINLNTCPWTCEMGARRRSLSFSTVSLSSRRSAFVPTRMMGVFGQWCDTSGCLQDKDGIIRVHKYGIHNAQILMRSNVCIYIENAKVEPTKTQCSTNSISKEKSPHSTFIEVVRYESEKEKQR